MIFDNLERQPTLSCRPTRAWSWLNSRQVPFHQKGQRLDAFTDVPKYWVGGTGQNSNFLYYWNDFFNNIGKIIFVQECANSVLAFFIRRVLLTHFGPFSSFFLPEDKHNDPYFEGNKVYLSKAPPTGLATNWTLILTVAENISPGSECQRRKRIETFIVRATNMYELFISNY